ncbi:MAG: nitroreductase family protein [Peptoniphilaceae bacterium]|nr:nitroreductase family protein [Peptoniphilaceae bacterium]MDY6086110.1 nitroreductase family protein [Peptoniphilaceae bacterium]
MYENDFIRRALAHRTIREFQDIPVEEDKINALGEVARHTSTSIGLQWASIVRVTNPVLKKELAEIAHQDYIARAPELWVFVADAYRNGEIAKEKGLSDHHAFDVNFFFQAFSDALLMAQNVLSAVESMKMGGCFLGSLLNDAERVIQLLHLPEGTFPALGLMFGYPAQEPQLKPRIPNACRFFENSYSRPESFLMSLENYDETMQTYYDLRDENRRSDTFTDQVVRKVQAPNAARNRLARSIAHSGFKLYLEEE